METVRKGHESELLRYLVEEFPLEQGFTIVFHGRRRNLDLVANSVEEAQMWMRGLQLLVDLVASMNNQEQLEQYQPDGVRVWTGVTWSRAADPGTMGRVQKQDPGGVGRGAGASIERMILKEKWMLANQSLRHRTQDGGRASERKKRSKVLVLLL